MAFDQVGKGFVGQYYPLYGANRASVAGVYRENSLMTYQGRQLQGVTNIMTFFAENVTFNAANFQAEDVDCHPTQGNGVLVVVNGLVAVEGETRPIRFNDTFILATDAAGAWYVSNQIFRTLGAVQVA